MKKNNLKRDIIFWMGVIAFGLILVFFVYHSMSYAGMFFSGADSSGFIDPRGVAFVQVVSLACVCIPIIVIFSGGADEEPPPKGRPAAPAAKTEKTKKNEE